MFNFGFSSNSASGTSSSTTNTNRTDSYQAGTFDTFRPLRRVTNELGEFDLSLVTADANTRAAQDTQGAISNIFRQYQETSLPQIFGAQTGSGAYGTTTGQLLANDAFARATNQSAELQLGVASSYVGQALSARDQLMQQFSMLLQANLQQSGTNTTTGREQTIGRTTGRQTGISAGVGTGGGGGGSLTGMS